MIASQHVYESKVIVIGAGFSGIGLGAMLKRRHLDDFVILERGDQIGGTWRENTYPGIACDVPSQVYSYSFAQNPNWSRVFSPGAEIRDYLHSVAEQEGVTPHIRFNTDAHRMDWSEDTDKWVCHTSQGTYLSKVLVLACGRLSEPHIPPIPGIDQFAAQDATKVVMHSSRWRHDVHLAHKHVVVVGSGASAIQIVPELAAVAKKLTVLQRSAPYIVPRNDRKYSDAELEMFRRLPETMADARQKWFWDQEQVFAQRAMVDSEIARAKKLAIDHLHAQVCDPKMRQHLTPNYEIGCKRVLLSDNYYPTFSLPNVKLIHSQLAQVLPGTVVAQNGDAVNADVLVLATGFLSSRQPYARKVFGVDGVQLAEKWHDGMYAHNSVSVPGFPNMFILNGPNSGLGHNSAIVMIETQIEYLIRAVTFTLRDDVSSLQVKQDAAQKFRDMIEHLSEDTVWLKGGCETSWYKDSDSGKLTLLWPGLAMSFRQELQHFRLLDFEVKLR